MARVSTSKPLAPKKVLSVPEMERGLTRLDERIGELKVFDIGKVQNGPHPELTALSAAIIDTLGRCFGENTSAFNRFASAATLQFTPMAFGPDYPLSHHYQAGARDNIARSVALLQEAQRTLREDLTDAAAHKMVAEPSVSASAPSRRVFVVHGHDDGTREAVARFLERIRLEAVILHERPNKGRTIITKFREEAAGIGFAVVLMTPDDHGGEAGSATVPRARQNVVFELGFFIGVLGPERVVALVKGDIEPPSDFEGVVYIPFDEAKGWKSALGKELEAAGIEIDWNQVMRA